ncbi:MAG: hypothetical protein FWC51_02065 [Proteobacteria bacterium]|nr:hypothetical protein [Pseudomonadota bacterium]
MKNTKLKFLSLLIVFSAFNASAATNDKLSYNDDIKQCDKTADHDLKDDSSTVGITRATYNQTECYKSVLYKIIDKYYAKQAEDMKKDLADYITMSARITEETLRPDSCYPQCGTIVGINAASISLETVKQYYENLAIP